MKFKARHDNKFHTQIVVKGPGHIAFPSPLSYDRRKSKYRNIKSIKVDKPQTSTDYFADTISDRFTLRSSFSDNVHASAVAIDSSAATPFVSFT